MNSRTHRLKSFLLLVTQLPLFFLISHAFAGSIELSSDAVLPAGSLVSLRFLQNKVAAGAIANRAHQARFEVSVTDSHGKPLEGVRVPLPVVVEGGTGRLDGSVSARVEWLSVAQPDGTALTDAQGIARGLFTSGHRTGTTVLQVPGEGSDGVRASIEQVWTEIEGDDRWEQAPLKDRNGLVITFIMRYQPHNAVAEQDAQWEPITGHQMSFEPLKFNVWNWGKDPTKDGDSKPDGEVEVQRITKEDSDPTAWRYYSQFVTATPVTESSPGRYTTTITYSIPQGDDGADLFVIDCTSYMFKDMGAYGPKGPDSIE